MEFVCYMIFDTSEYVTDGLVLDEQIVLTRVLVVPNPFEIIEKISHYLSFYVPQNDEIRMRFSILFLTSIIKFVFSDGVYHFESFQISHNVNAF